MAQSVPAPPDQGLNSTSAHGGLKLPHGADSSDMELTAGVTAQIAGQFDKLPLTKGSKVQKTKT